ncbi:MAG: hypothetical protein QOF44_2027, partial [Streptomyces sp.]|nr:hypothetical protein [Streptomyces sp.]
QVIHLSVGLRRGSRARRHRGLDRRCEHGRAGPGRLVRRLASVVSACLPAADRAGPGPARRSPAVGTGGASGDGRRGRRRGRRGARPAPAADRLCQLPACVGLDAPVGFRLAGRQPDLSPVASLRAGRRRHGAPRRAAGLGVLPGRHDRGGRARRQYQPTVDRAAGLRRRPDRAAARGGARRSATARTRPQMAAGLPRQRHGHDRSTCGTWRP